MISHCDIWGALVDVDVQLIERGEGLLALGAADLNRQACAHLGPDECHLGAQAELATRLLDTVLGARQHSPQQVGDVLMPHPNTVVLPQGSHTMQSFLFKQGQKLEVIQETALTPLWTTILHHLADHLRLDSNTNYFSTALPP